MAGRPDVFMPLFIGDYLADTTHLSTEEHGAYLLILMHYWTKGEGPPDNDKALANIAKLPQREWQKMADTIRAFFSSIMKDGKRVLVQKRIEEELARAIGKYNKRKEALAKANEARNRAAERTANATANGDAYGRAYANADGGQNGLQSETTSIPIPIPTLPNGREDDDEARARNLLTRICEILRIDLSANPERITWARQVREMIRDGIPEPDILAATEKARVRGILKLAWIRAAALNPSPPQNTGPPPPQSNNRVDAMRAKWAEEDEQNGRLRQNSEANAGGVFPAVTGSA
jgi:uncharacterized protein YdaU (DUF1376 family)